MSVKDPASVAAKWVRNLGQSAEAMRAGVRAVTKSPTQAAAERTAEWVQGVADAVDKWRAGLARVSLADWQAAMENKGIARVASGAKAAEGAMQQFLAEWLPYEEAGQRLVASMPTGDLQSSIDRAAAMIRHNAAFKRRMR